MGIHNGIIKTITSSTIFTYNAIKDISMQLSIFIIEIMDIQNWIKDIHV